MQLTDCGDLWIDFVGPVPPMDAAPRPRRPSDALLDGEKTGAALLFSGVLLALVGVTFTAMGWKRYQSDGPLEWTRLLGPILISVGGTFVLTSVCKFGVLPCWPCGTPEGEVLVVPVRDRTARPPFVLRGINQPVVVQGGGGAAMVCIPPPYGFIASELRPPAAGAAGLPSYDAMFCVDNATVAADEGNSATGTETDYTGNSLKTEQERRRVGRSDSSVSQPPAYEDIYPAAPKRDP